METQETSHQPLWVLKKNNLFKITKLNIPVDKQVARFTMYTGVVKLLSEQFQGCVHDPPLRDLIEEAWRDAAKKLGTPPWKKKMSQFGPIGSKLFSGRKCGKCPVEEFCEKTKGIDSAHQVCLVNPLPPIRHKVHTKCSIQGLKNLAGSWFNSGLN